jgi:hypothetical protein
VTLQQVALQAVKLQQQRTYCKEAEASVVKALNTFLDGTPAALLADQLEITPQYLSDIRRGRRAISDEVVSRLCDKLKAKKTQ